MLCPVSTAAAASFKIVDEKPSPANAAIKAAGVAFDKALISPTGEHWATFKVGGFGKDTELWVDNAKVGSGQYWRDAIFIPALFGNARVDVNPRSYANYFQTPGLPYAVQIGRWSTLPDGSLLPQNWNSVSTGGTASFQELPSLSLDFTRCVYRQNRVQSHAEAGTTVTDQAEPRLVVSGDLKLLGTLDKRGDGKWQYVLAGQPEGPVAGVPADLLVSRSGKYTFQLAYESGGKQGQRSVELLLNGKVIWKTPKACTSAGFGTSFFSVDDGGYLVYVGYTTERFDHARIGHTALILNGVDVNADVPSTGGSYLMNKNGQMAFHFAADTDGVHLVVNGKKQPGGYDGIGHVDLSPDGKHFGFVATDKMRRTAVILDNDVKATCEDTQHPIGGLILSNDPAHYSYNMGDDWFMDGKKIVCPPGRNGYPKATNIDATRGFYTSDNQFVVCPYPSGYRVEISINGDAIELAGYKAIWDMAPGPDGTVRLKAYKENEGVFDLTLKPSAD